MCICKNQQRGKGSDLLTDSVMYPLMVTSDDFFSIYATHTIRNIYTVSSASMSAQCH